MQVQQGMVGLCGIVEKENQQSEGVYDWQYIEYSCEKLVL